MNNNLIKGADLTMMRVVLSALRSVKKEMDDRGVTFDEFLQHYENLAVQIETLSEKCN